MSELAQIEMLVMWIFNMLRTQKRPWNSLFLKVFGFEIKQETLKKNDTNKFRSVKKHFQKKKNLSFNITQD